MEGVQISHNGTLLTEVFGGQSATLKCAGKKMVGDVVVAVPEQMNCKEPLITPLVVTKNGTYEVGFVAVTEVWDDNTAYEFSVQMDENIWLRVKKSEKLTYPHALDNFEDMFHFIETDASGVIVAERNYCYMVPISDGDGKICGYMDNYTGFSVLWVKSGAFFNEYFGISKFEDNAVYLSNYASLVAEEFRTVALTAPGPRADGFLPVMVDVQPSVQNLTVTKDGTYTATYADYLSSVTVKFDNELLRGLIDKSITEIDDKNITDIGDYAFYDCRNLTRAAFEKCNNIGDGAFKNCTGLTSVDRYEGSELHTNDIAFRYQLRPEAFCNSGISGALKVSGPEIMTDAFYGCVALTSVTVDLNGSISPKKIGLRAFGNCTSLESVKISCNDTQGGDYRPFIWLRAFEGCTNLVSLTIDYPLVMKTATGDTQFPESLQTIYVPANRVDAYKADAVWGLVADKIMAMPEGV